MNGWQETPRSEELSSKYDLKSRESVFSCTPSHEQKETTHQLPKHLQIMLHYAGFIGGGGFARFYLAPEYSSHMLFYLNRF